MSKTTYTPGPWRVLPPSEGVDANWHVTNEADTFVAHVFGSLHAVDDQSRINAHFIAASPDLYAAAWAAHEALLEVISTYGALQYLSVASALDTACAKAEGRS